MSVTPDEHPFQVQSMNRSIAGIVNGRCRANLLLMEIGGRVIRIDAILIEIAILAH